MSAVSVAPAGPGRGAADVAPLVTRGLTKRYGSFTAVDRLDLEVRRGEIFGLLGQNGAGKTTTILMLLGLTEPTAGEARVVGLDPARAARSVKRRVGYLPDAVGFYDDLSGRANLRYTANLNGLRGGAAERAIDEVLDRAGLGDRGADRVGTYSRGMRQRLGIADALVKDPDILILDEPTTAIDPIGVQEILTLLQVLSRERGLTILLSSHLLSQVQSVCDRVGIFADGRLIGQGTVSELAGRFGADEATIEVVFAEDPASDHAATVERALGGLAHVRRVVQTDRPGRPWDVTVSPAIAEPDVRAAIPAAGVAAALRLVGLRPLVPSLDDIYRVALRRRADDERDARAGTATDSAPPAPERTAGSRRLPSTTGRRDRGTDR